MHLPRPVHGAAGFSATFPLAGGFARPDGVLGTPHGLHVVDRGPAGVQQRAQQAGRGGPLLGVHVLTGPRVRTLDAQLGARGVDDAVEGLRWRWDYRILSPAPFRLRDFPALSAGSFASALELVPGIWSGQVVTALAYRRCHDAS